MALLQSIRPGWLESSMGVLTILISISILSVCVVLFSLIYHSIQLANVSTFDSCPNSRSYHEQSNLGVKNTGG